MKKQEAEIRGNQRCQQHLASAAGGDPQTAEPGLWGTGSISPTLALPGCRSLSCPVWQHYAGTGAAVGHRRGGALLEQVPLLTLGFLGCTNWPCSAGRGEGKLLPGLQSPPAPCVLTCTLWTPSQRG